MALLCLDLGCAGRRARSAAHARAAQLDVADALWARRDTVGFDAVAAALGAVEPPTHPDAAWRLARLHTHRGIAAEPGAAARRAWADARRVGLDCAQGQTVPTGRRGGVDWRGVAEGLAGSRQRCAAWAAMAWARSVDDLGATAAAVDVPRVEDLVAGVRASASGGDPAGVEPLVSWALGVLHGRADDAGSRRQARQQLRQAYTTGGTSGADDLWVRWEDLQRASTGRGPDLDAPGEGPDTPAERAAAQRLRRAAP